MDHARRNFLKGRSLRSLPPVRPPGALEADIEAHCTACHACIDACPTGIIASGGGGLPEILFEKSECTFCDACAQACPEPVFSSLPSAVGFKHTVAIDDRCLADGGIYCQSCADACPQGALRFAPRIGGVPRPQLDTDLCTGCGACISACPVRAIGIAQAHPEAAHV